MKESSNEVRWKAEFDLLADDYYRQHKENVAITGEDPDFFARYKVADLAGFLRDTGAVHNVLDFGCGIGNSIAHFREYFPESLLYCSDVSARSIEISKARFPGEETYLHIKERLPLPNSSVDVIFTACVFHHIPHDDHDKWLAELKRVIRPGGTLAIYEHNPLNPLTVHAVNHCPLDANARLVRAGAMTRRLKKGGWKDSRTEYKLFFPSALSVLRPFERYLCRFFLGAQWRITVRK